MLYINHIDLISDQSIDYYNYQYTLYFLDTKMAYICTHISVYLLKH